LPDVLSNSPAFVDVRSHRATRSMFTIFAPSLRATSHITARRSRPNVSLVLRTRRTRDWWRGTIIRPSKRGSGASRRVWVGASCAYDCQSFRCRCIVPRMIHHISGSRRLAKTSVESMPLPAGEWRRRSNSANPKPMWSIFSGRRWLLVRQQCC
jgi:hypothetical protein